MKFERKGVGKIIVLWRGGGCGSARDRGRDNKKLRFADICGARAEDAACSVQVHNIWLILYYCAYSITWKRRRRSPSTLITDAITMTHKRRTRVKRFYRHLQTSHNTCLGCACVCARTLFNNNDVVRIICDWSWLTQNWAFSFSRRLFTIRRGRRQTYTYRLKFRL